MFSARVPSHFNWPLQGGDSGLQEYDAVSAEYFTTFRTEPLTTYPKAQCHILKDLNL